MTFLPAEPTAAVAAALAGAAAEVEPEKAPLEWPCRLVAAIVAILDRDAPGAFAVFEMPDKIAKVDIGAHDGVIVVHYRGSKYEFSKARGSEMVERTFDVDVHVIARGLTGRVGAQNVVEKVRRLLQNRCVEGSTPLAPIEDGFANEQNGVWDYVIQFRGQTPAVGEAWPHREDRA